MRKVIIVGHVSMNSAVANYIEDLKGQGIDIVMLDHMPYDVEEVHEIVGELYEVPITKPDIIKGKASLIKKSKY